MFDGSESGNALTFVTAQDALYAQHENLKIIRLYG
jgi:hypothetical protein